MGTCLRRIGFPAAVLSLFVFPAHVLAQTDNDERYKAERQKAVELFKQNKTLEALPLFDAGPVVSTVGVVGFAGAAVAYDPSLV